MASFDIHIKKYELFRKDAENKDNPHMTRINACFESCFHLIEACADSFDIHINKHQNVRNIIEEHEEIFDDRIQISNIGALMPPLNKHNLGEIAVRRNPVIADLFHRIKFVEKMGTGLRRIKEECRKHGNARFEIETNGYFIATFRLLSRVFWFIGKTGTHILLFIT